MSHQRERAENPGGAVLFNFMMLLGATGPVFRGPAVAPDEHDASLKAARHQQEKQYMNQKNHYNPKAAQGRGRKSHR